MLLVHTKRAWQERGPNNQMVAKKDMRAIAIPERIEFLRTGPYVQRAVLIHHGHTAHAGHYTSACWLGQDDQGPNLYGHFNDAHVNTFAAHHVFTDNPSGPDGKSLAPLMRTSCHALVYVRDHHWTEAVRDGTEQTPYQRGPSSEAVLRPE